MPDSDVNQQDVELYAAWFTTLGVLINRSGGETIITNQECIDAQHLEIKRELLGDGSFKFIGTVKEK